MADLYDKFGRKIIVGDVLKVYHFTAALRRKRHYMYKQVVDRRRLPKGLEVLVINHLDLNDSHYLEVCDGRKLNGYEIVQDIAAKLDERERQP